MLGAACVHAAPAPTAPAASRLAPAASRRLLSACACLQCSAEGGQHCSYPSSSGDGGDAHMLFADVSSRGGDDAAGVAAGAAAGAGGGYSEVHMVLRMPHPVAPAQPQQPACGRYGSVAEMEALIEHLQGALALKEQQRQAAADAYARRVRRAGGRVAAPRCHAQQADLSRAHHFSPTYTHTHTRTHAALQTAECDNLTRVVRELSQGRARAAAGRARLAEQYVELQGEYHRMLRIADLSRTVRWGGGVLCCAVLCGHGSLAAASISLSPQPPARALT